MFLKVQKFSGKLLDSKDLSKEHLGDIGSLDTIHEILEFTSIKINIIEGNFINIAIPACSDIELYFYENETEISFSDCIYELSEHMVQLNENKSSVDFFLNMSYTPAGTTQIDGLMRLIPSRIYSLKDGVFTNEKINYSSYLYPKEKSDYESFITSLQEICKFESKRGKVGIFFSGGVDSLSLALILESLDIPFTLYTGKMVQGLYENEKDVLRSISISKERGWNLKIISVDYNDYNIGDLERMIEIMPTTSHLSVLFLEIAKEMSRDNVKVCFSGQNLDILYNFEATTSLGFNRGAFVNLARRFFMSEVYFSTLSSKLSLNIFVSLIARLLLLSYCIMRKSFKYRLPRNKEELFHNYTHNPDLTVFSIKNSDDIIKTNYKFGTDEGLRAALIRSRIEESLTSGPPMSIINAGKINNIKVVLPYSSELLIPFFMNLKTSFKDIFYPKKIIHQFVNNNIKSISKHDLNPKDNLPTYHNWAENIFPKTKLAKSLKRIDEETMPETATPALNLSYQLSYNWKEHIFKTLKDKKNGS